MNDLKLVDKTRFPLTTQEGLSEDKQALIDAIALDNTHEWLADGNTLKPESQARLKELEEKYRLRHGHEYGKKSVVEDKQTEPVATPNSAQEEVYRGDPQFRLTDEQAARVAKGHREMMAMPNKPPIDLTRDD
jgi:hypothetical protein